MFHEDTWGKWISNEGAAQVGAIAGAVLFTVAAGLATASSGGTAAPATASATWAVWAKAIAISAVAAALGGLAGHELTKEVQFYLKNDSFGEAVINSDGTYWGSRSLFGDWIVNLPPNEQHTVNSFIEKVGSPYGKQLVKSFLINVATMGGGSLAGSGISSVLSKVAPEKLVRILSSHSSKLQRIESNLQRINLAGNKSPFVIDFIKQASKRFGIEFPKELTDETIEHAIGMGINQIDSNYSVLASLIWCTACNIHLTVNSATGEIICNPKDLSKLSEILKIEGHEVIAESNILKVCSLGDNSSEPIYITTNNSNSVFLHTGSLGSSEFLSRSIEGVKFRVYRERKITHDDLKLVEEALIALPDEIKDIIKEQFTIKLGIGGMEISHKENTIKLVEGKVFSGVTDEIYLHECKTRYTFYHELGHILNHIFDPSKILTDNFPGDFSPKLGITNKQVTELKVLYDEAVKKARESKSIIPLKQTYFDYITSPQEVYAELFAYYIEEQQGLGTDWPKSHGKRGKIMEEYFKPLYEQYKKVYWTNKKFLNYLVDSQKLRLTSREKMKSEYSKEIKNKIFSNDINLRKDATEKFRRLRLYSVIPKGDFEVSMANIIFQEEVRPLIDEINKYDKKVIEQAFNEMFDILETLKIDGDFLDVIKDPQNLDKLSPETRKLLPLLEKLAQMNKNIVDIVNWNIGETTKNNLRYYLALRLNEEFKGYIPNPFLELCCLYDLY